MRKTVTVEEYYEEEEVFQKAGRSSQQMMANPLELQNASQSSWQAAYEPQAGQSSRQAADERQARQSFQQAASRPLATFAPRPSAAPPVRPHEIEAQNQEAQLVAPTAGRMLSAPSSLAASGLPRLARMPPSFPSPFGSSSMIGEMMRRSMWGPPPPVPPAGGDPDPNENQVAMRSVFTKPFFF